MDGILVDETAKVTMISFFIVSEFQGLSVVSVRTETEKGIIKMHWSM